MKTGELNISKVVVMALFVAISMVIASIVLKKLVMKDLHIYGSYFKGLNSAQISNIQTIIHAMDQRGIKNKFLQAGILATISKESGFVPKSEIGYGGTSNPRIRKIFGSRVSGLSDSQLTELKKDDRRFFERVYGGRYGNTSSGDGYKYRGRGFNQLTFKGNYSARKKESGIDIVANPDLLDNPEVAAIVAVSYFKSRFEAMPKNLEDDYKTGRKNAFNDLEVATQAMYHANAGWGKSIATINRDVTGGFGKAKSRATGFYELAKIT